MCRLVGLLRIDDLAHRHDCDLFVLTELMFHHSLQENRIGQRKPRRPANFIQTPGPGFHLHHKGEAKNDGKKSFFFSVANHVQGEFDLVLAASQVVPFNRGIHFFVNSAGWFLNAEKRRAAVEGLEFGSSSLGLRCQCGEHRWNLLTISSFEPVESLASYIGKMFFEMPRRITKAHFNQRLPRSLRTRRLRTD